MDLVVFAGVEYKIEGMRKCVVWGDYAARLVQPDALASETRSGAQGRDPGLPARPKARTHMYNTHKHTQTPPRRERDLERERERKK